MVARSAEQADRIVETLTRAVRDAALRARPTALNLAIRAALHPVLRPFLADPTVTISGRFVSLDAQLAVLLDMYAALPGGSAWAGLLPGCDRVVIGSAVPGATGGAVVDSWIGAVGGALYVSATGVGVACGVRAALVLSEDRPSEWPAPIPIRGVSASVEASAGHALTETLRLLCLSGALPVGLRPGAVFYDVVCPDISDEQAAAITGDSLALPLAIAFVSALTGCPVSPRWGATGALSSGEDSCRVLPVGSVHEKAVAFAEHCRMTGIEAGILIVPSLPVGVAPQVGVHPSETLRDAVCRAIPELEAVLTLSAQSVLPVYPDRPIATLPFRLRAYEQSLVAPGLRLLAERDRAVSAVLANAGGYVVRRVGGEAEANWSLSAAFATASQALSAASAILQALVCSAGAADTPLPGFALDCASDETLSTQGEIWAVVRAARPGQVLVTAAFHQRAIADHIPADFLPLGLCRLNNLRPPVVLWALETIYQCVPAGSARLPRTLNQCPNNLPVFLLPTVGRDKEIALLGRLLQTPGPGAAVRTISGPGGVGKTRLALEAAAASADHFPEGIWVVDTRAKVSAEAIAAAVSETLRLTGEPTDSSALDTVRRNLAGRRTLLILDNSETAPSNAAIGRFVTELPLTDLEVAVLVTARSPLCAPGETVLTLHPLQTIAAPGRKGGPIPALEMFHACAASILPGFALTSPADRRCAGAITTYLGGLPLAMELAAAALHDLPLAGIASRLLADDSHADPLTRAWELVYALLSNSDQALLSAISVFAGGFTEAAACSVVGGGEEIAGRLQGLYRRRLIQVAPGGRYHLHSLVQAFTRDKLFRSGCDEAVSARHAGFFAALCAHTREIKHNGAAERELFDRLDADMDNVRSLSEWLLAHDPAVFPRVAADLIEFLRLRGHLREWRTWPARALKGLLPADPLWARLTRARGAAALDRGALDDAEFFLGEAYAGSLGDENWAEAARANNLLGVVATRRDSWDAAEARHETARELYRRAGDEPGEIGCLNSLGLVASRRNDKARSREHYEAAVALSRRADDRRGLAVAVGNLGVLSLDAGDPAAARRYFEECLSESRALRDTVRIALALVNLGDAVNQLGEWEFGTPMLVLSQAIFRRLRHHGEVEANQCLALAESAYGASRIAGLQREFARQSLPDLLDIDPSRYAPRRLRIDPPAVLFTVGEW